MRHRGEPSDLVEISLPLGARDDTFVIRVPERGGLPPVDSLLPRGHLLLRIEPTAASDASASVAIRGRAIELARDAISERRPTVRPERVFRPVFVAAPLLLAILLVIWLLFGR
jgi:hypothetical protein